MAEIVGWDEVMGPPGKDEPAASPSSGIVGWDEVMGSAPAKLEASEAPPAPEPALAASPTAPGPAKPRLSDADREALAQRILDAGDISQPVADEYRVAQLAAWRTEHAQEYQPEDLSLIDAISVANRGLSPDYIAQNLPALREQFDRKKLTQVLARSPRLREYIANPAKAAVVKAQAADLGTVEWLFGTGAWWKSSVTAAPMAGMEPAEKLSPEQAAYVEQWAPKAAEMAPDTNAKAPAWAEAASDAITSQKINWLAQKQAERALHPKPLGLSDLITPVKAPDDEADDAELEALLSQQQTKDYGAQNEVSRAFLEIAGHMAPYLAMSAGVEATAGGASAAIAKFLPGWWGKALAVGGPMLAQTVFNTQQNYGSLYLQLRDMKDEAGQPLLTREQAATYAKTGSAIGAALMGPGSHALSTGLIRGGAKTAADELLKKAAPDLTKALVAKQMGKMMAAGVANAGVLAATNAATAELARSQATGRPADWQAVSRETWTAMEEFTAPSIGLALLGSRRTLLEMLGRRHLSAEEAARRQVLEDTLRANPLFKPVEKPSGEAEWNAGKISLGSDAAVDAMQHLAQGEMVYVTREAFERAAQSHGVDPEQLAARIYGDGGEAYRQAMQTKAEDLAVPAGDFYGRLGGTELLPTLREDIRLSQDLLTLRQAKSVAEHWGKLEDTYRKAKVEEMTDDQRSVYEDYRAKGLEAGRSPEEADHIARLLSATMRSWAEQMSEGKAQPVKAADLYRDAGLVRVAGPDATVNERAVRGYKDPVPTPAPHFKAAYRRLAARETKAGEASIPARLYYRDPTTRLLNERALRDLPVDPERPMFGILKFGHTKAINDAGGGHERADDVYRALGVALNELEPHAAKFGGDLAVPAMRDQAEMDALLGKLRERFPGLPITGTVAPRAAGETWADTAHRLGDVMREHTATEREAGRFPTREAPVPAGVELPASKDRVRDTNLPQALIEKHAGRTAEEVMREVYYDPTGVLSRAGWEETRRANPKEFVASLDARAIGAMDKAFGHEVTDDMVAAISRAARLLGGEHYDFAHVSGDEFRAQGNDRESLEAFMVRLRDELARRTLLVESDTGSILEQKGLHVAYGTAGGPDAERIADAAELPAAKRRDAEAGRDKAWFEGRSIVHEPGSPGFDALAKRVKEAGGFSESIGDLDTGRENGPGVGGTPGREAAQPVIAELGGGARLVLEQPALLLGGGYLDSFKRWTGGITNVLEDASPNGMGSQRSLRASTVAAYEQGIRDLGQLQHDAEAKMAPLEGVQTPEAAAEWMKLNSEQSAARDVLKELETARNEIIDSPAYGMMESVLAAKARAKHAAEQAKGYEETIASIEKDQKWASEHIKNPANPTEEEWNLALDYNKAIPPDGDWASFRRDLEFRLRREELRHKFFQSEEKRLTEARDRQAKAAPQTGTPIVARVKHGTSAAFDAFDKNTLGEFTGAPSAKLGFFFAGSDATAKAYFKDPSEAPLEIKGRLADDLGLEGVSADAALNLRVKLQQGLDPEAALGNTRDMLAEGLSRVEQDLKYAKAAESDPELKEERWRTRKPTLEEAEERLADVQRTLEWVESLAPEDIKLREADNRLLDLYVKMRNPYVHDYEGSRYREDSYFNVIKKAKDAGHDGVILLNTFDGGPLDNIFVVFNEKQVKHATDNSGEFDPNVSSFLAQPNIPAAQARVDPLGFYSQAEQAALSAKQVKGTPDSWYAILSKAPGVKAEELEFLGLKDWLSKQGKSVTREDVAKFIAANRLEVKETKSGAPEGGVANLEGLESLYAKALKMDDGVGNSVEAREVSAAQKDVEKRMQALAEVQEQRKQADSDELKAKESDLADRLRQAEYKLDEATESLGYVKERAAASTRDADLAMRAAREGQLDVALEKANSALSFEERIDQSAPRWTPFVRALEGFKVLQPQYEQYAIGGHKEGSYHELLFYAPQAADFAAPHFSEHGQGLLAHARISEHVVGGKRALMVEEVQSDLHQQAKEKGYAPEREAEYKKDLNEYKALSAELQSMVGTRPREDLSSEEVAKRDQSGARLNELDQKWGGDIEDRGLVEYRKLRHAIPDAPLKTTWDEFIIKRLIRYAAENGYDRIAWTTGAQQAERYDLSKQVDSLHYYAEARQLEGLKDGAVNFTQRDVKPEDLPGVIGKEAAEKLLNAKPREYHVEEPGEGVWHVVDERGQVVATSEEDFHSSREAADNKALRMNQEDGGAQVISGADLAVGGQGMRFAYDKRIPSLVEKWVKKFGGKVEKGDLGGEENQIWNVEGGNASVVGHTQVWMADLPEALRSKAMSEGFPLFQKSRDPEALRSIHRKAVKEFGVTESPYAAGYILPDGQMLNLSEAGGDGTRTQDHRSVERILPEKMKGREGDRSTGMLNFVDTGVVRMDLSTHGHLAIHLSKAPTGAQLRRMGELLRYSKGSISIDVSDRAGSTRGSFENDHATMGDVRSFLSEHFDSDTLYQRNDTGRGFVTFTPHGKGPRRFSIQLMADADRSTFAHETFHYLMEVFGDLQDHPDTTERMKADYSTLLKFMGFDTPEQRWTEAAERQELAAVEHRTAAQTRRMNTLAAKEETVAHAWEQYLAEGKAPDVSLVRTFAKFRAWMLEAYKRMHGPQAVYEQTFGKPLELSDDVRKVFDRLLSADLALGRAEEGLENRLPAVVLQSMTPAQRAVYQQDLEDARANAMTVLVRRMAESSTAELKGWKAAELARLREKVDAELKDNPVYQAIEFLQKGVEQPTREEVEQGLPVVPSPRLDRGGVEMVYGKPVAKQLEKQHPGVFGTEDRAALSPDDMAELLGHDSGDALVQTLLKTPSREQAVQDEAARRFKDVYGAALEDGGDQLAAAALDAVHDERHLTRVMRALHAMARLVNPEMAVGAPEAQLKAVKKTAERILQSKTVAQVNPGYFVAQERSAAAKAFAAAEKGNLTEAYAWKQSQAVNAALYRAARDLSEHLEKGLGYLQHSTEAKWRGFLGQADPSLRDAHDALLAAIGLGPTPEGDPLSALPMKAASWDQPLDFDVESLQALSRKPRQWKDLTTIEAENVLDAAHNLRAIARRINEVEIAGQKMSRDSLIQHLRMDLETNIPRRAVREFDTAAEETRPGQAKFVDWLKHLGANVDANLLTTEKMVDWIVGGDHNSPVWKLFVGKYLEARDKKSELLKRVLPVLEEAWDALPKELRNRRDELVEGLADELPLAQQIRREWNIGDGKRTRSWLWMLALNYGAVENRQRIKSGLGWDEAQVERALSKHLSAAELKYIQKLWDGLEMYWPELQAVHETETGLKPKAVERVPFTVRSSDGETVQLKGGYYPLSYDRRMSGYAGAGEKQAEAVAEFFGPNYVRAATNKSSSQKRVDNFNGVVNLSWGTMGSHLAQVTHDIAFRAYVKDVGRILLDKQVRGLLTSYLGPERADVFVPWLKTVANMQADSAPQNMKWLQRALNGIRGKVSSNALGWSWQVAAPDVLNPLTAVAHGKVSMRAMTPVLATLPVRWSEMRAYALEHSAELRQRSSHADRKIQEQLARMGPKVEGELARKVKASYWAFMEMTDALSSTAIWTAKMKELTEAGVPFEEAVRDANAVVRDNLPAMNDAEQAAIVRDRRGLGQFFMFYGYWSRVYGQLRDLAHTPYVTWRDPNSTAGRKAGAIGESAARVLAMAVVVGAASELVAGAGPEPGEDRLHWLTRKTLLMPAKTLPVVGQMVEASITQYIQGKPSKISVRGAPAAAALQTTVETIGDLVRVADGDKDASTETLWRLLDLVGLWKGIPTRQPGRTGKYLIDLAQGDEPQAESAPAQALDVAGGLLHGRRQNQAENPFTMGANVLEGRQP